MTRGVAYSRHALALGSAGLGVAWAMVLVHHLVAAVRTEHWRRAAELEGSLTKQVAARSDYEDSKLDAQRARVGSFRSRLAPGNTWDSLVRLFGKGWTAEPGPSDVREGFSLQAGTFILVSPAASDWPQIVEAVEAAEQRTGVGIASFEMKSSGNAERRTVDLVKIVVAIHARPRGFTP